MVKSVSKNVSIDMTLDWVDSPKRKVAEKIVIKMYTKWYPPSGKFYG